MAGGGESLRHTAPKTGAFGLFLVAQVSGWGVLSHAIDGGRRKPQVKFFDGTGGGIFNLWKSKIVYPCGFQGNIRLPPSAKNQAKTPLTGRFCFVHTIRPAFTFPWLASQFGRHRK
jgi:hypothetical protein